MLKTLILLSIGYLAFCELELDINDVLPQVSYAEFKEKSAGKDFVTIIFDPNCKYCQDATNNLITSILLLKPIAPQVEYYRIDGTTDEDAENELAFTQVPYIFYKSADAEEYKVMDLFKIDDIIQNVLRMLYGPIYPITSSKNGQKILETVESVLIYTGSSADDEYEQFSQLIETYDFKEILVTQIEDPAIAKELVIPKKDKIILYTSHNDNIIPYNRPIDISELAQFVSIYKKAPVSQFTFYDMQELYVEKSPLMIFIAKEKNSLSSRVEMQLEDAVNILRSKNVTIKATILKEDKENEDHATIMELLGVPIQGLPLVLIIEI